jgi:hypothetical protein
MFTLTPMFETMARTFGRSTSERSTTSRRRPSRRFVSGFGLEGLEGRLAPSSFISPSTASTSSAECGGNGVSVSIDGGAGDPDPVAGELDPNANSSP